MAHYVCRFGNLAPFQWKCAAAPAPRQFMIDAGFFAAMLFYKYAQAMGIQEENQIGRGPAQNSWAGFRAFWSAPIGILLVYWPVYTCLLT